MPEHSKQNRGGGRGLDGLPQAARCPPGNVGQTSLPSHHFPASLSLPLDMASQEGKGVEQPFASLVAQPVAVAIGSGDFPQWTQDPLGFLRCDTVFPLPALQSPLGWRTPSQRLPESPKGQSYPPLSCWKRSAPRLEERLGLQVL